ncbi:Retrovirus-related Pol polyprotein from transposon RE1 [Vitis vinifera]|uniref:Retrovirus-related Pol polyprotein from transposon RE1 n=1 Tax=Vitis vinifera TaxID=29760 RepID=A0A438DBY5_VITVI|nr:Retrovirus-related Pol polyprotein from transposon RE1 [Vitis vinifera]
MLYSPQNRQTQAFQTLVIVPPVTTSITHDSPSIVCYVLALLAPDYCTLEMVQRMLISVLSAMGFQGNNSTKFWYVDSGASNHMTNNLTTLCHVRPYIGQSSIQTANGSSLPIAAIGDASSKFTDVFLAPQLSTNLIFVSQLVDNNCAVNFSSNGCVVQDQVTGEPIVKGPKVGCLFPLFVLIPDFSPLSSIKSFACNNVSDISMVWHRRLGHPNTQIFSHVLNSDLLGDKNRSSLSLECDSCKFDLHLVSSRFQLGIVCTRCSRPQSLSVAHPISDPTTLQIQSVATPLVRCSPRVSVPPNRYGFPSSNSGNSISTLTVALSNFDILTCYSHAAKHDCWRQAMQEEIAALKANHTWDIEPCPPTIVPLGCKGEYGVNYEETFAPMAKMITVCTILALAASSDWPLHQMDVKNAFLHGDLKKCIYMKPPPGLFPFPTSHVYMGIVVLLVYVDDIVITSSDSALLGQLKTHLSESFHMKDLGSLTYFLGLEVHHSPSGISLNQHKYASDLVATDGLQGATSVDTPMELNVKLRKEESDLLADPSLYRKLVGSLVYLTITRPDISFAVQQVSQFLQTPRHLHLVVVRRIICYVQGTSTRGLFFPIGNSTHLAAYSDADWASCADTHCSITGWCVFLGDALISWKNFSKTDPTPLHADNTSAIQITANPVYHECIKHIEVDCHSIREAFEAHVITLPHISTDLQIADIFTKALPRH